MNLELDLWFSSGKCLNLGLDHRFRSSSGSNRFKLVEFPTQFSAQKLLERGLSDVQKYKHSLVTFLFTFLFI